MTTWVLLRGLARDSRHWGRFMPALEATHRNGARVIALDLPGNGELHAQRSPVDVAAMVRAYRLQLQARSESGPLHLLGLSLGSMVAIAWAQAHPEEVASVVAVNGSARDLGWPWERMRLLAWPALMRAAWPGTPVARRECFVLSVCSNLGEPHPAADEWARLAMEASTRPVNALRQLAAALTFCLSETGPAVPMLVVVSGCDRLVSPECSIRLASRWHLPLVIHPNAGHELALDAPKWLALRCAEWVEELSRKTSKTATAGS
jgi:pimeloyl-ACP methyl ester carboxylesterase